LVLGTVPLLAQNTASVTVTATVSASAKLTLSTGAVTFANADPDTVPSIAAPAIDVEAKAKTSAGSSITLTVQATQDLTSGSDTIGIANLTWTASGGGFVPGTMGLAAQNLGAWTNSGSRSGTQTYSLANSWSYATGSYTTTINYTLTAP
jgi:hypothetical protein